MQNRRYFLKTGISVAAVGVAGASALMGARRSLATEAPPETTSLRLGQYSVTCTAPLDIVDDLLREEGFADVRYEHVAESLAENITRGEVDFGLEFSPPIITAIDAGWPVVMLAGVHLGCEEMFAHESIRSVVDLKGKKFGVLSTHITTASYVVPRIIVASVGLDPAKDINWVVLGNSDWLKAFAAGEIDAFMMYPPWAQELHARRVGHVILSTVFDHPWSQYFCCMLVGSAEFVRRNPVATKRVVRAMVRATDICSAKPDWVAQRILDRGFPSRYDFVRQGMDDVSYRNWREFDPEDAIRFYTLRLRELGMIKSSPDKIIAQGTDWRFLGEVRRELG